MRIILQEKSDRKCLGSTQGQSCTNEQQLRKAIVQAWVKIDQDKTLCQRFKGISPFETSSRNKKEW